MQTNIFMVRHAESPFVFGEERTRGLSEEGLQAAMKVADLLDPEEIHFVCSSSYTRARETVQYLADRKNLPIIEFEELRERPIKGLNYKAPWDELQLAIEKSFVDLDFSLDGGESINEAQRRSIPVINNLLKEHEGRNIVIGTHGNIMTIILNYYNSSYGFEFWKNTSKPDIYRMTFVKEQFKDIERIWT
jgi:2,3-bisphosphoglycerate-dependent phosphoglycerate mutase